jgi:hypothetical protein
MYGHTALALAAVGPELRAHVTRDRGWSTCLDAFENNKHVDISSLVFYSNSTTVW